MPQDEIEETKQQHHAQLQAEHNRLAEYHEKHAGGMTASPEGGSIGAQAGGFVGAIASHKWWIIGGVAALIVIFFVIIPALQGNSNNTANQQPNYSATAGGFVPADIGTALDNINTQLSGIGNQLGQGGTQPPPTTTPPPTQNCGPLHAWDGSKCVPILHPVPITLPPPPVNPPPPHVNPPPPNNPPQQNPIFVTVARWTQHNTPWNSTLSGIAQHEGLTLQRIEQLNPQIRNPNLVFTGEQVRVR